MPARAFAIAQPVTRPLSGNVPAAYAWYAIVCTLDLCLTHVVVGRLGGIEVNGIAHAALQIGGFAGLIALKLLTMVVFIGVCEAIRARKPALGKRVAEWGVAVSAIPVVVALVQLGVRAAENLGL